MKFNKVEMIAIMSMANAMIMADGKVEDEETIVISHEIMKFGVPIEDFKEIYLRGIEMEPSYATEIVSKMTPEQKKYVAAFLGTIMAVDGGIDEKEMALWRLLSQICGLPTMSVKDAVFYMAAND